MSMQKTEPNLEEMLFKCKTDVHTQTLQVFKFQDLSISQSMGNKHLYVVVNMRVSVCEMQLKSILTHTCTKLILTDTECM